MFLKFLKPFFSINLYLYTYINQDASINICKKVICNNIYKETKSIKISRRKYLVSLLIFLLNVVYL